MIDFGATLENAPALGDQLGVVLVPGAATDFEQPLAFLEALRRVRIRVDEDVQMVEGRQQADVLRQQHAVAEYVAGHVADADDA